MLRGHRAPRRAVVPHDAQVRHLLVVHPCRNRQGDRHVVLELSGDLGDGTNLREPWRHLRRASRLLHLQLTVESPVGALDDNARPGV